MLRCAQRTDGPRWFEPLRSARWPEGIVCPRCGGRATLHSKTTRSARRRYLCLACRRTFSDLTGTLFSRSKVPVSVWLECLRLVEMQATTADMARVLGVKWDTARRMEQRIRAAMKGTLLVEALRLGEDARRRVTAD